MAATLERPPERYADRMTPQIAIRISEQQLKALDEAVESGEVASRSDGVRRALTGLLAEIREREIAREYREAYTRHPQDPKIGEAGAILLAEFYKREEAGSE